MDREEIRVRRGQPTALAVAILLCLLGILPLVIGDDRIMGRVFLDGMAVGGWTRSRAEAALAKRAADYLQRPVELHSDSRCWRLKPGRLGISIDYRAGVARALARGRKGWLGARLLGLVGAYLWPQHLTLEARASRNSLAAALTEIVGPAVQKAPRNASFDPVTGRTIPAADGSGIDYAATGLILCRAVLDRDDRQARLILRRIPPATREHDLTDLHLTHVLATFSTSFAGSSPDRAANIRLGAAQIHGALIRPGGGFSFNATTGPREAARGYRPAPEIVRQELRPGIGGGICQVATILYNTVLLAGLPILERSCHALPPSYVPLGRDAAVYYPLLDFRFTNATPGYLMILANVIGDTLQISLLGETSRPQTIRLDSQILARLDPPVVEADDPRATRNKAGAPGYRVRVIRYYGQAGQSSRAELVSEDVYYPVPRVAGYAEETPLPAFKPAPKPAKTAPQVILPPAKYEETTIPPISVTPERYMPIE